MNHVCASGPTVNGYDVSHYQPNLNIHAQMKQRGDAFCFIKATEGIGVVDHLYAAHYRAAKAQGMITGAYNFFHPAMDPIAQAKKMESVIGPLGAGDLGPVIDWEATDGTSVFKDREAGYAFLSEVGNATGKTPIVYTGPYFGQALSLDSRFLKFPLWVAHYGTKCPLVPGPWQHWTFWQFTDAGGLDLNIFNGSLEDLKKLAGMA